jgi:hypothetical protein
MKINCMIYESRGLGFTFCASTMGGSFSPIATGAGTERESQGLAASTAKRYPATTAKRNPAAAIHFPTFLA